jgi:hypothetical protein
MKHVAPLSVLAFLFLLYFVLPFVGQHSLDHLHADVPAAPNPYEYRTYMVALATFSARVSIHMSTPTKRLR